MTGNRRGSAYLVALAAITMLLIMVVTFSKSSVARRFSTRLMSNEARAEGLAQSAADMVMRYLRDNMNKPSTDIYDQLRKPLGGMSAAVPINLGDSFFAPLRSMAQEMNNATLDCEVSFLDTTKITDGAGTVTQYARSLGSNHGTVPMSEISSEFKCDMMIPGGNGHPVTQFDPNKCYPPQTIAYDDEYTFKTSIKWFVVSVSVKVHVELKKDPANDGKFRCKVWGEGKVLGVKKKKTVLDWNDPPNPIDINKVIGEYINLPPDKLTIPDFREQAVGMKTVGAISFPADDVTPAVAADYEKAGIIRVKTTVVYEPNGPGGPKIKRVLLADREFKVSDTAPIAPEYTFFSERSATNMELGGLRTFFFHNMPEGTYNSLTANKKPGRVHVGGSSAQLNTYLGTQASPFETEYNFLTTQGRKSTRSFQPYPIFEWQGRAPARDFDFPVVRSQATGAPFTQVFGPGVKKIKDILNFCDWPAAPTMLFGKGHFEYAMGLAVEGAVKSRVGNVKVSVKPDADDSDDATMTTVTYIIRTEDYAVPGFNQPGASGPPQNRYSLEQYAKKATHFFDSASEFLGALSTLDPNGMGVVYVKGDLSLSGQEFPPGLIVCSGNISINGDVKVKPSAALGTKHLGLVAPEGFINFGGSGEVQASCYSEIAPVSGGGGNLQIKGNLVCKDFNRSGFDGVELFYDEDRTGRDLNKEAPKRYVSTIAKFWKRFAFEKL